jgi:hypothetical protein
MDLFERLMAADAAARQGNHEHALSEFLWVHNHVLDEDEAFAGVRLSFALSSWATLAAEYPPALNALRDARSSAAARVLSEGVDGYAFQDVVAIDDHLGQPHSSYDLLLQLRGTQPDVARLWAHVAWEVAHP